jgi:hypothetical protein
LKLLTLTYCNGYSYIFQSRQESIAREFHEKGLKKSK